MSNSIVLEGFVDKSKQYPSWNGTWRFLKDKKGSLQFNYSRFSHEIPADLFEYVSFLDPISIATNAHQPPPAAKVQVQASKPKKRGRGRPPMSSSLSSNVPITETTSSMEDNDGANPAADDEKVEEVNQQFEEQVDESITTTESISKIEGPVTIPDTHPLFGVWHGNFSIKTATGDEVIDETLFFYRTIGSTSSPLFKELPPEPQIPFSLLKQMPMLAQSLGALVSEPITDLSLELNAEGNPEESIEEASSFGFAPSSLEMISRKILIGFGRNAIGRFSVAALYDESSGELRCEKKYMQVKYAIKRGRRSYVEYAITQSSQPSGPSADRPSLRRQESIEKDKDPNSTLRSRPVRAATLISTSGPFYDEEDISRKKKATIVPPKITRDSSKGFSRPPPTVSKSPREILQDLLRSNPNAIVGPRNPDNDDPNSGFKEAFMDCDTGEVYEGEWAMGVRHGRGICIYCDGLMYEGSWQRGREHGRGDLMTGDRRIIYSGDWYDGIMHGYGLYFFGNGDKYSGDWKEGNRQGKGEYEFADGCYYYGDWKDNRRHGKGRFLWADGSFYEGEWENDLKHGRGVLELANGFKYDGQWNKNIMDGKGWNIFPSGQSYQGTFRNGLRDGRGSIQFAEGAIYEGRFKEDRFDGQGTLKVTNAVPGNNPDETLIPVQIQADLWRIHWKAGYIGPTSH